MRGKYIIKPRSGCSSATRSSTGNIADPNLYSRLTESVKVCTVSDVVRIYISEKKSNECVQQLNEKLAQVDKYFKINKLKRRQK